MSKNVYEFAIELLDRKFRFLMETQDASFNLELERFVTFLTEDELVRDVADKLRQEIDERKAAYQDELKQVRERSRELKDRLLAAHPETADQPNSNQAFDRTFVKFDQLDSSDDCPAVPKFQENSRWDDSKVKRLIDILCSKLATLEDQIRDGKLNTTIDRILANDIGELQRQQEFNFNKWFNFNKTSSGMALIDLMCEVSKINPHPSVADYCLIKQFDSEVAEATYSDTQQHKYGLNKSTRSRIAQFREKVRRVYEGIRQEIGATRLRSQLLDRYATRCKLYNREAIRRQLVEKNEPDSKREECEYLVTQDLALYLYDQGITTAYRHRVANRELDLVDLDSKSPMVIEV